MPPTLFTLAGGYQGLFAVATVFYEKVYQHRWLSQFFAGVDQKRITKQQADFMQGVLGGPKMYRGKTPGSAHVHINITDQAFDLRQELLRQSLAEKRVHPEVAHTWLQLDEQFRRKLVRGLSECRKRYGTDRIVNVPPLK